MISDFAVLNAHYIYRFEADLAVSGSHPKERPFMRPVVGLVCRHTIAIRKLPVNLRMKIRECLTNGFVEFSHTRLVRSHTWLRRVICKVVGEKFFENIEISLSLDLFCISAYNGLRRL